MLFKPLFANFIAVDTLNLNLPEVEKFLYELKTKTPGVKISNRGGWHSYDLDEKTPIVKEIYDEVLGRIDTQIKEYFSVSENTVFCIENMWANINNFGDWNTIHFHKKSLISGVFYVKVPKGNCGEIQFLNPNRNLEYHTQENQNYNENNSIFWRVPPEENKIVFFPSWLEHFVTPNLTNEDRISFSFNLNIKK